MVAFPLMWSTLSSNERRVSRLIGFEKESFNADQLLEVQQLLSGAKELGINRLDKLRGVKKIQDFLETECHNL